MIAELLTLNIAEIDETQAKLIVVFQIQILIKTTNLDMIL